MRYVNPTPPSPQENYHPPAPVWAGSPVDKFKISLRIFGGDDFDPDRITRILGCRPTVAEAKGRRITTPTGTRTALENRWSLTIESNHQEDLESGIRALLHALPSDREAWRELTQQYSVDLYCGMFLRSANRGFGFTPELSQMLADRNLPVGFDLYFDQR